MEQLECCDLFGEIEPLTVTIDEAAARLKVSTATIRNWIKTNYLKPAGHGKITLGSLENFEKAIAGQEKLNQRANKLLKDSHDHNTTTARLIDKLASSVGELERIGDEYEASLSESYRNKEGIYYTPAAVVCDLFAQPADDIEQATFCDPCCGTGNFIVRAIALGFKPANIAGYDVDPVAVEITRSRIFKLTGCKTANIKVADFLNITVNNSAPQFDYIYTNPPWGKKIEKSIRDAIGLRLGAGSSTDTCALFFFMCLQCLKENGRLGLLLPDAFFNIAAFENARINALNWSIERLIDYGRVFKGLVANAQAMVLKKQASAPVATIVCETRRSSYKRVKSSFSCNPKSILNLYCDDRDALTLQYLMSIPHITLKNHAAWGLGIVTGNNKQFVKSSPQDGYIAVYKGADILDGKLKPATSFIPADMNLYQQVAPRHIYEANEKLVYKFISSKLRFFYDDRQCYFLNSANMLIPEIDFPVPAQVLGELLSSDLMNWMFSKVFNTHKILRGDLELLPIYSQFLYGATRFDEENYLDHLQIKRDDDGNYRIKR